jgi:hypothetical protein
MPQLSAPANSRFARKADEDQTSPVSDPGKALVVIGLVIVAVGLMLWSGIGRGWLGRLPGDIHYSRGNFTFAFPIVTCLLISAVLTLLMWLFRR